MQVCPEQQAVWSNTFRSNQEKYCVQVCFLFIFFISFQFNKNIQFILHELPFSCMCMCSYTGNADLLTESKGKNTAVIILFTIIGIALLLVIGIACCLFSQRRKETKSSIGKFQKLFYYLFLLNSQFFFFVCLFVLWHP